MDAKQWGKHYDQLQRRRALRNARLLLFFIGLAVGATLVGVLVLLNR